MTEAEWLACTDPQKMLEFLRGKASERRLRLFACASLRHPYLWDKVADERTRGAVQLIEQWLDCPEDGLLGEAFLDARESAGAVGYAAEDTLGRWEDTLGLWHRTPAAAYLAHAVMRTAGAHFSPSPDPFPLMALAVAQYAQTAALRQAHVELLLQPPYSLEQAELATQPGGAEALAAGRARFEEQGGVGLWQDRWREWVWAPQLAQAESAQVRATNLHQCASLRDLFGPLPFRPVRLKPAWLVWEGGTVPKIAQAANDERAFDHQPLLADALEEVGCTNADILSHLRGPGPHVRGCWALDLILGKE